jgi:hypothetical protein
LGRIMMHHTYRDYLRVLLAEAFGVILSITLL